MAISQVLTAGLRTVDHPRSTAAAGALEVQVLVEVILPDGALSDDVLGNLPLACHSVTKMNCHTPQT